MRYFKYVVYHGNAGNHERTKKYQTLLRLHNAYQIPDTLHAVALLLSREFCINPKITFGSGRVIGSLLL